MSWLHAVNRSACSNVVQKEWQTTNSAHYRWFTDPVSRLVHPESDHAEQSRLLVADLHGGYTREGGDSRTAELVDALNRESPECAEHLA
ncbi:hypothetical protein ACFQ51_40840 [Streptomyces kaempferi]